MIASRTGLAALQLLFLLPACAGKQPAPEPLGPRKLSAEESPFRLFSSDGKADEPSADEAALARSSFAQATEDGGAPSDAAFDGSSRRTVGERLEQTTLSGFIVNEESSLRAVVGKLRGMTGLPLVVLPAAEDAVHEADVVFDFRFENELSATHLLNLIAGMTDGAVGWTIRHDAILFTTDPHGGQKLIVHAHDIHDLVVRLPDDPGDEGGSKRPTATTEDEILTLVRETVAPETWALDGIRIDAENGQLIVVHTVDVQLEIRQLLESLR